MTNFTEAEVAYLASQPLGRLATVGSGRIPHVVPVGFRRDGDTIVIGGLDMEASKKWRDIAANDQVAFVVDDLVSVEPWLPRGVEIRGQATLHRTGGEVIEAGFGSSWIRIEVRRIVGWGLDGDAFGPPNARSVG